MRTAIITVSARTSKGEILTKERAFEMPPYLQLSDINRVFKRILRKHYSFSTKFKAESEECSDVCSFPAICHWLEDLKFYEVVTNHLYKTTQERETLLEFDIPGLANVSYSRSDYAIFIRFSTVNSINVNEDWLKRQFKDAGIELKTCDDRYSGQAWYHRFYVIDPQHQYDIFNDGYHVIFRKYTPHHEIVMTVHHRRAI